MSERYEDMLQETRRSGIGGSDIAWVMGMVDIKHPYHKTAYEVYEEKVNGVFKDFSQSESVIWGNRLEIPISNAYTEMTGEELYATGTFRHKKYPFLIAHPDRILLGKPKGVEIKTTGQELAYLWGESGSKDVPEAYYMQIAHYMLVLDYASWDLCVLIGGQDFRVYTFERDSEVDEMIIEKASRFWHHHVENKIPPPIDYSDKGVQQLIKRKYKIVSDECVQLGEEYREIVDKIEESEKNIKNYTKMKNENRTIILNAMGCAGKAYLMDGRYFERVMMTRKGYTVKDANYIKLNFKGKGNGNHQG